MSIEQSINDGIKLHQQGQLNKALVIYKEVLQISPDHQVVTAFLMNIAQSYFQLSQLLVQMGRVNDAIDSLKQVVFARNETPDAHFQLGQLYIRAGDNQQAVEHLRFYLRLVPADTSGAVMLLAHVGEEAIPEKAPHDYLQQYYTNYAVNYDEHLVNRLDYKCPQIIFEAMKANNIINADVLDLGCGTGLSGAAIKSVTKRLDGVDLSQAMLAVAQQRNIYDNLNVADIYVYLENKVEHYDAVIAAGLFEHIGKTEDIYEKVFSSLRDEGCFIFTADENIADGVVVNSSGFYMHGRSYLEKTAEKVGFTVISNDSVYMRRENNAPVSGLIVVLKKSV